MSVLKSLTFTTLPKIGANPTLDRRSNMIARLEEQKLLLSDPNYIRTLRGWAEKAEGGDLRRCDQHGTQRDSGRSGPLSYLLRHQRGAPHLRIEPVRNHRVCAQDQCRFVQLRGSESAPRT